MRNRFYQLQSVCGVDDVLSLKKNPKPQKTPNNQTQKLLKVRKLARLNRLTKNQTFHRGAVALLKSLSSKYHSVSSGAKLVLLPKIATSVKIVFAFLKIFFFFFVLIVKEYESCPSKKETEKDGIEKVTTFK